MNSQEVLGIEILSQEKADRMFSDLMRGIRRRQKSRRWSHVTLAAVSIFALGGLSTAGTFLYLSTNSSGQTYGALGDAGPNADPDLILAMGNGGVEGYILATDLNVPKFTTREEVAKWLEANPPDHDRTIPLYKSDGKTIIGTFTVQAGVKVPVEDAYRPKE